MARLELRGYVPKAEKPCDKKYDRAIKDSQKLELLIRVLLPTLRNVDDNG
jgi:hypothetical protein